jgi:hypothetical protein
MNKFKFNDIVMISGLKEVVKPQMYLIRYVDTNGFYIAVNNRHTVVMIVGMSHVAKEAAIKYAVSNNDLALKTVMTNDVVLADVPTINPSKDTVDIERRNMNEDRMVKYLRSFDSIDIRHISTSVQHIFELKKLLLNKV